MKKIIITLLACTFIACSEQENYKISIELPDAADSYIILNKTQERDVIPIDSVMLDSEGKGTISGTVVMPGSMFLTQQGSRSRKLIFIDNVAYNVNGNTFEDATITAEAGPHKDFIAYTAESSAFDNKMQQLGMQYRTASEAGVSQDSLKKIRSAYEKIQLEKTKFDSVFMNENPSSYVSLHLLRGSFYSLDGQQLENRLEIFDPSLHETDYYVFLSEYLERMKSVKIGEEFVDFELPDTAGNPMKVSDVAGESVLLIDFWASWCGPCRRANPEVVEIYNEFHDKGFDILGVSLDNDKEKWLQAIEDDNLTWSHMSDLAGWQSAGAKLYAVSSIPHTVLLDSDGTIIARNLSKEELKEKLETLL